MVKYQMIVSFILYSFYSIIGFGKGNSALLEWSKKTGVPVEMISDDILYILKRADEYITMHDKEESLFNVSHNKFSLFSEREMVQFKGFNNKHFLMNNFEEYVKANGSLPVSYDLEALDKLSAVKDQGKCGSCYAFATIASIESQIRVKHNVVANLAEQQIVDCDRQNDGCDGGTINTVFQFAKNGLCLENDYKYIAKETGKCRQCKGVYLSSVESFKKIPMDEESLKDAIFRYGAVVVAVDSSNLQFYKGGIYDKCDRSVDHAVVAVGWGYDAKLKANYWKIRNSWGSDFGENGYFRMIRSDKATSDCGIYEYAYVPILV